MTQLADYSPHIVVWQDLETDAPGATLGHRLFRASFDEDVGSTLLFDRAALKRVAADPVDPPSDGPPAENGAPAEDDQTLVCVTTKRLKFRTIGYLPKSDHAQQAGPSAAGGSGCGAEGASPSPGTAAAVGGSTHSETPPVAAESAITER